MASESRRGADGRQAGLDRRQLVVGLAALAGFHESGAPAVGATARRARSPAMDRVERSYALRLSAAQALRARAVAEARVNGDETRLPQFAACFTKALPHDALGLVDPAAYRQLLSALASGDPERFEDVPLGRFVRLADPQAAFAYDLVGCDSSQLHVPPSPTFSSSEQAAEMVELYWHALLRDLPFESYPDHPLAREACEDLSRLSDFHGPKQGGRVTAQSLFRGTSQGDLVGPYLSQFLWKPVPYVPMLLEQKMRMAVAGRDYMTRYDEWLAIQDGAISQVNQFEPERRYLRTGRDLGELVHRDFTYQAFLSACLILLKAGTPIDGGNPYKHSRTQAAFSSFGPPFVLAQLATATQLALKACWFHKWLVSRRLRPEELGGRVHDHLSRRTEYPLHRDLLTAAVIDRMTPGRSWLLPQAYPEGSPIHPSYPAGHAAIAGACTTLLKAFFDESYVVPEPVVPGDGLSLLPWQGPELTVGGELDKLASNIAIGRNVAGVHFRSDAAAGLALGEAVAVDLLRERKLLENDLFSGFSFRSFTGERIVI